MKRSAWISIGAAALAISLAGCEWETGSGVDSWSSSYDWVNFSGVYRGKTTVDDPGTPGATNEVPQVDVFTMIRYETRAEGKTRASPVVKGSVTITVKGAGLADPDHDGILSGPLGSGTFNYQTGNWSIEILPAYRNDDANQPIYVAYSYLKIDPGSPTYGGEPYSFVVHHRSRDLTLTDNKGARYEGQISQIRSASGSQNTDIGQVGADESANDVRHAKYTYQESPLPEDGDTIIASFEAMGVGAKIVGTLEGTVVGGVFANRTLNGTRIAGRATDDINATAGAVKIETPTTNTNAPAGTPSPTGD